MATNLLIVKSAASHHNSSKLILFYGNNTIKAGIRINLFKEKEILQSILQF